MLINKNSEGAQTSFNSYDYKVIVDGTFMLNLPQFISRIYNSKKFFFIIILKMYELIKISLDRQNTK